MDKKELFRHRIIMRFLVDYDLLSVLSIPSYHLRNVFQCSWPMLAPCPGSSLENWNLLWEVVLHIQSSCIKPLQQTVYLVTKLQKNLSPNGFGKDFFPFFHGSVIWVISNKCRRVTLSKDLFEKPLAATAVTVTCKRFHLCRPTKRLPSPCEWKTCE